MAINGSPRNGAILMCDFAPHELELISDGNMVKTRPVVVVSPQHQRGGRLIHVVPISMTAPKEAKPWHVEIPLHCLPAPAQRKPGLRWAKCDMVVTVGYSRLNRYEGPKKAGQTIYYDGNIDLETMVALKKALASVFGIRSGLWTQGKAADTAEADFQNALDKVSEMRALAPEIGPQNE
jgi:uncharacterized protein YifN (PemK superfamily)